MVVFLATKYLSGYEHREAKISLLESTSTESQQQLWASYFLLVLAAVHIHGLASTV